MSTSMNLGEPNNAALDMDDGRSLAGIDGIEQDIAGERVDGAVRGGFERRGLAVADSEIGGRGGRLRHLKAREIAEEIALGRQRAADFADHVVKDDLLEGEVSGQGSGAKILRIEWAETALRKNVASRPGVRHVDGIRHGPALLQIANGEHADGKGNKCRLQRE